MASSSGLLAECAQQLKGSAHDYEKLLGSCVESVWRTIGASVERQLRLRKGVGIPSLGKFAFVRGLQPLTPVFVLHDRFMNSYGVVWRRPPPALLTPVTDLNFSVVGNEAGGLPKDQVCKTLESFLVFVGTKLQKGVSSGRVRLGNVGAFTFDGKAMAFQFDPTFVKSIVQAAPQIEEVKRVQPTNLMAPAPKPQPAKSASSIPRAVSLQVLAPVEPLLLPTTAEAVPASISKSRGEHKSKHRSKDDVDSSEQKSKHRSKDEIRRSDRHHDSRSAEDDASAGGGSQSLHRHDRLIKSTSHLLSTTADICADKSAPGQILPRFMLPDPSRSPSKLVYNKQALALERTFDFKREELRLEQAQKARQEDEIARRTDATRLRCVQERAEKIVNQRDLDAFLSMQIDTKDREKHRQAALDAASTNFDAVRVLPRDPIVTKEQRQAAKDKLRGRLHDQVTLKASLAKHRLDVDRAESAYFMAKVLEQGEREREQREQLGRATREALTAGWQQQRAIHEQCEQLRQTTKRC